MTTSGTTVFNPALADLVVECFSRLQIRGPALTTEHIIEARRSMNLILNDWSGNRSVNLWAVDLLSFPLQPGIATYTLPSDTIQLLDVYVRQFSPNTVLSTIGNALTPMLTSAGVPMVTGFGDPMTTGPGSQTFSTVAGSATVTMNWPANGLMPGNPVFITGIASVGGLVLQGVYVVATTPDLNTLTFQASGPAAETQKLQGAPPLLQTVTGSANVFVIYPNHRLVVGSTFTVAQSTTVGGLTLSGSYSVTAVANSYQFTIVAATPATASTAVFVNNGKFQVTSQAANVDPIDTVLYGLSRSDYAAIPDKFMQAAPTSFWFNRQIVPTLTVWQVPPPVSQTGGIYYTVSMYRMRQIQDANPLSGQTGDFPQRFFSAFCAELTAALAEKFQPELFKEKVLLAVDAWTRASAEDGENVPWFITPGLSGYYL